MLTDTVDYQKLRSRGEPLFASLLELNETRGVISNNAVVEHSAGSGSSLLCRGCGTRVSLPRPIDEQVASLYRTARQLGVKITITHSSRSYRQLLIDVSGPNGPCTIVFHNAVPED